MNVWKWIKKNSIIIAASIGIFIVYILLSGNSNRRGVHSDNELSRQGTEIGNDIERSIDEINGERESLRENHRAIESANKSVQSELEYAIGILRNAKERAAKT